MKTIFLFCLSALLLFGCNKEGDNSTGPIPETAKDPNSAVKVSIDRFSSSAGNLFIRTDSNNFPAANKPIDFDVEPFITRGLGPNGGKVAYYNFDVQTTTPAPIYVLLREGENTPVTGQLNIVDVVPGDQGYNDFWQVFKVTVPGSYVANSVTSVQEIIDAKYKIETTNMLVNCPIVPENSTAKLRLGSEDNILHRGWYKGKIVFYFTFDEKQLSTTSTGLIPQSPIYVTFTINPGLPNGGPPSGFKTEPNTNQTHNVPATIPSSANYSPLWLVSVYDNAEFLNVMNLSTAQSATILAAGIATVNCPIVSLN